MMTTKELLDIYYMGFAQKQGWETVISDDFKFVDGDMTQTDPIVGKQAQIEIIKRFSRLFGNMRPKKMILDGDNACVIENTIIYFLMEKQLMVRCNNMESKE